MYINYNGLYRGAVTAYQSLIPIILNNSEDLNRPPYQALNYQPNPNIPAYTYVPIAIFNKVGAKVRWDEATSTIHVTDSNACEDNSIFYKQELANLKAKYDYDTRNVMTDDDLAYVKSKGGNRYGVLKASDIDKANLRAAIDFSVYPPDTYIKWFKIIEFDINGRQSQVEEYIKPHGYGWMQV